MASARIMACSSGLTEGASATAFWIASQARTPEAESIPAFTCGPEA